MDSSLSNSGWARLYRWLCSTQLAVLLFLAICLLVIPGTVSPSFQALCAPLVNVLLGLMGASTFACTLHRRQSLRKSVLVIHCGVIVTLAGAVVSSFGSVATVNVYEGDSVGAAYNWDLQADTPLGFELAVRKIGREYYPTPVRVGVLQGEEKVGLFTLATGQSFSIAGFQVTAGELDAAARKLQLTVRQGDRLLGTVDTSVAQQLAGDFPYQLRLVSYKTPKLKRIFAELTLSHQGRLLAQGVSEVNSPLHWRDLDLFHVKTSWDASGRPYAGIQVVRDPGAPVVFAGLILVSIGALLTVGQRFARS